MSTSPMPGQPVAPVPRAAAGEGVAEGEGVARRRGRDRGRGDAVDREDAGGEDADAQQGEQSPGAGDGDSHASLQGDGTLRALSPGKLDGYSIGNNLSTC